MWTISFTANVCIKFNICLFLISTLPTYKLTVCPLNKFCKPQCLVVPWLYTYRYSYLLNKQKKTALSRNSKLTYFLYQMLTNISIGKYHFKVCYSKSESEKRHCRIYQGMWPAKYSRKDKEVRQPRNVTNMGDWIIKEVKNLKHVYSQHESGHAWPTDNF